MFARKIVYLLAALLLLAAGLPAAAQGPGDASQLNPEDFLVAPGFFTRAEQAFRAGDYEQAVVDYSLFILLNPTIGQAYFERGRSYESLGELNNALEDYTSALNFARIPEEESLVRNAIAVVHAQRSNFDDALEALEASLAAFPDNPDTYLLRGEINIRQQRFRDAVLDYGEVIDLAPEFAPAYFQRGVLLTALGNLDMALDDFTSVIEMDPAASDAYLQRANIYIEQEELDAALQDLNSAIDISPEANFLYLLRGFVNSQLSNDTSAADDYFQWINGIENRRVESDAIGRDETVTLEMEEGLVYRIPFEARAGQRINVQADSPDADPLLVILDTEGTPIIASDDADASLNAAINGYRLPSSGTYTLVISHAGGPMEGSVVVTLDLR